MRTLTARMATTAVNLVGADDAITAFRTGMSSISTAVFETDLARCA
jgi:hypothetical protein